jgi:hypothetical protein
MAIPSLSSYGGAQRDLGYAGQVADQNPVSAQNLANEGATSIDFGTAVARGSTDATCKAPAADGDVIIGIAMRHPVRPAVVGPANTLNYVGYAQYDEVPIMRQGDIFVLAFENTTQGDTAISVTAQNGRIGSATGGAAGAGRVALPNATWLTTTPAGQVGIVRIRN